MTPFSLMLSIDSTITTTPMIETSSMDSLPSTCEAANAKSAPRELLLRALQLLPLLLPLLLLPSSLVRLQLSLLLPTPPSLPLLLRCMQHAANNRASMSKKGRRKVKTPYNTKAKPLLTLPFAISAASVSKHVQPLTSSCMSSGKWSSLMKPWRGLSCGFFSYSNAMSKRSSMTGSVMPTKRSVVKATVRATTKANAGQPARRHVTFACLSPTSAVSRASAGRLGKGTPKDETVEPTQKTAKQEKPNPKCISLFRFGGLSKPRKRHNIRMYANISGEAHLETACTVRMQRLAQRTCPGRPPRCNAWPKISSTTLTAGMAMA
mmetsp:Transcript_20410/g.51023  ORF Transcript_20410/g.51023 Transcript_20410/m.51023 type:complete len:321 (+) Transcript_20410:209-1171(+)